jgi:hypothetical protein
MLAVSALAGCAVHMPGQSFSGPLPPLTPEQTDLAASLRRDVDTLATKIGERNVDHPALLARAADFLDEQLTAAGYTVQRQTYTVRGVPCSNLQADLPGWFEPGEIVLIGAHYDAVRGCPAADDNGSGVAATLALARAFAGHPQPRTIRFVLFVNEEPPYFWTRDMGSLVYAKEAKARGDRITAMLSLETLGYYSDEPGSQTYPPPFGLLYPSVGNFVAFVGNYHSRDLVRRCVGTFRDRAAFPCEGGAIFSLVPRVGSSDHWSFWQEGYSAVMVTDTAPHRYPYYHKPEDTPDKLDYEKLVRVVNGLRAVAANLAEPFSD